MKAPEPLAYINRIDALPCGEPLNQKAGVAWIIAALNRARMDSNGPEVKRAQSLYGRLLRSDAIASRSTCVADYRHENWGEMTLFRENKNGRAWHRPTLEERMKIFRRQADLWASEAFDRDVDPPQYLIQISCTGYDSPHAVQKLASQKGWGSRTRVLHIGHMGCYASVPSVALAAKLLSGEGPTPRVSLLFAEMCTLHLKPGESGDEQVVMNALFADGAARLDVGQRSEPRALALYDTAEMIVEDSAGEMTWSVADSAFSMSLGRAVPARLRESAQAFIDGLLARNGLSRSQIARFAVHPGGPKIIDDIAQALSLKEDAVRHSRQVLRERGNMSSSTLPHIWKAMTEDPDVRPGDWIVSLAFGPGLTFVANLLRQCQ